MKSNKTGAWVGLAVPASARAVHLLGFDTYLKYHISSGIRIRRITPKRACLITYRVRFST